jgi:hypothetical protein
MNQVPGFMAEFERVAVVHKDTSDVSGVRDDLIALTVESQNLCQLEVVITGYNEDPRALYDVPEVRRWIGAIMKRWPDMLFWLTPGSLWIFLLSLNPEMVEALPGHGHRIAFDTEVIAHQVATTHVAAEAILREKGLDAAQFAPIHKTARDNLFAMYEKKRFGDYIVIHPKHNQPITYRRTV